MSELTMASYSGCRQSPVPHTRIEDEVQMEEVYIIGKKLGEGNFGIVRKVVHKETNVPWACKVVNKEKVCDCISAFCKIRTQCLDPDLLLLFVLILFD